MKSTAVFFAIPAVALAIGQPGYVEDSARPGSFAIVQGKTAPSIYVDPADWPGVVRAAADLRADIARVTGRTPEIVHAPRRGAILIGTLGRCAVIDGLVRDGKLDATAIAGKWESFLIRAVDGALVIAGSDKRGAIFGIYDLSEEIGVSPWYWWADVPVRHRDALFVKPGGTIEGPPAVKYRGIFLNDEAPALSGWVKEKYGAYNHEFYQKVFELLLRMKGNYLWPAMWGSAFNEDDPLNPKIADEWGVVMGTTHHEPMLRAQQEWKRHGQGPWDYTRNDEVLRQFWAEGLRRNKDYESIISIGMRGDGDMPMARGDANVALLERIVADQRKIIAEQINPNPAAVPQLWALYKEVQEYYEKGMRVPDDVTLLWSDDNWGNIRRLPTPDERRRSGGAGVYYHFDYVGGPRNYKWINTNPTSKVWEQMTLAWQYGADRIWIVNVGDLKPMEVPHGVFPSSGLEPRALAEGAYQRIYAPVGRARVRSGPRRGDCRPGQPLQQVQRPPQARAARSQYLQPDQLRRSRPRGRRVLRRGRQGRGGFQTAPRKRARRLLRACPTSRQSRFYLNRALRDRRPQPSLCGAGRPETNALAAKVRELFQADADLTKYYNQTLAGGKWNHMMDQTHIGYTTWQEPPVNRMPEVKEIAAPTNAFIESDGYVSIEAAHFTAKHDSGKLKWEEIPDYGLTLSAMTTTPALAPGLLPPADAPTLEYRTYLYTAGKAEVETILSPTLNFVPGRGLRYAISFDDEPPQIIDTLEHNTQRDWETTVKDAVRKVESTHIIAAPGYHTLKIRMVDPALVLEKIVINLGGAQPSYLGPPESRRQ